MKYLINFNDIFFIIRVYTGCAYYFVSIIVVYCTI